MRLALLKRRGGGDCELLEGWFRFRRSVRVHTRPTRASDAPTHRLFFFFAAFQSIIDNMSLSEAEITE